MSTNKTQQKIQFVSHRVTDMFWCQYMSWDSDSDSEVDLFWRDILIIQRHSIMGPNDQACTHPHLFYIVCTSQISFHQDKNKYYRTLYMKMAYQEKHPKILFWGIKKRSINWFILAHFNPLYRMLTGDWRFDVKLTSSSTPLLFSEDRRVLEICL